jgi:hypothetical protein
MSAAHVEHRLQARDALHAGRTAKLAQGTPCGEETYTAHAYVNTADACMQVCAHDTLAAMRTHLQRGHVRAQLPLELDRRARSGALRLRSEPLRARLRIRARRGLRARQGLLSGGQGATRGARLVAHRLWSRCSVPAVDVVSRSSARDGRGSDGPDLTLAAAHRQLWSQRVLTTTTCGVR